jgi:hypothetical protein
MTSAQKTWTDALRLGKYAQIHGKIHNENGYCCLAAINETPDDIYLKLGSSFSLL